MNNCDNIDRVENFRHQDGFFCIGKYTEGGPDGKVAGGKLL